MVAKVDEELAETKEAMASQDAKAIAGEMGDLLFAVVNLVRKSKLDAETVLAAATEKFIGAFSCDGKRTQSRLARNWVRSTSRRWTKCGTE